MTNASFVSRSRRHEQLVHRIAERLGARVRHSLDHDLIELRLKNVLAHAAMKKCRLVQRGPHLLHQLAKERLAHKISKSLAQFRRIAAIASSGRCRWLTVIASHEVNDAWIVRS